VLRATVTWTDIGGLAALAAQLVVLSAAVLVALRQVREAKRLREAQAQPFVVVDFEVESGNQEIRLVISNIGATMARDVRLTFSPALASSLDSHGGVIPPRELKPLREGIPSLPPGKRVSILFDLFPQREEGNFADEYKVEISFYAPALKKTLHDDSVLDLGIYRGILHAQRRDVHDVHERLKELVSEAKRWTASGSGIEVLTPRAQRARTRATLDHQELRKARGLSATLYRARIFLLRWLF
jgi:hypothetical protein